MDYPIPIERYDLNATIICESCLAQTQIDPTDFGNDGVYSCPKECGGTATFKYAEADACPNCGELGFYFSPALGRHCSRACMLQAEWKATLERRAIGP